jgi:fatty-acyl-CoA synthase
MSVFLLDAFERAAAGGGTLTVLRDGTERTVSWAEVHAEAINLAAFFQAQGLGPGSAVGLIGSTSHTMIVAIRAVWLSGASVTIVPPPTRLDPASCVEACVAAARTAGLDSLVICPPFDLLDGPLAAGLASVGCRSVVLGEQPRRLDAVAAYKPPGLVADDIALRQFTSGSTGVPKAVEITHGNLAANVSAMVTASRHEHVHDRMLSWLPLFHDMGLIGFLTLPMTCGRCRLILSPPEDFMARPTSWMANLSKYRATATAAPNFAYALAARLLRTARDLDLSALRFALCGGEPIDPDAIDTFSAAAGTFGFDRRVVVCALGMAESTLAVSFSPPGGGMVVDVVETEALRSRGRAVPVEPAAPTRRPLARTRLARLGEPVAGTEIRIAAADTGQALADREVGELWIRGGSVSSRYVSGPASEAAEGLLVEGWLRTGDLAYTVDGEVVVCGRIKEVVIVGGRNISPHEVERAASRVDGVRAGRVAAFRGPDGLGVETVVVAVETGSADVARIRKAVMTEVVREVGIRPREIVLLPPGSLRKTTSGKMRRLETRDRYLTGELRILALGSGT